MVELKKNHFYFHLKTKPNFIPLSLSLGHFSSSSLRHTLSLSIFVLSAISMFKKLLQRKGAKQKGTEAAA